MIPKNEAIKKGVTIIDSKQSRNALVETLKANFPQVIKDNQVDLQAIATLLGLNDKADIQGYELTFTGKGLANALYSTPTQKLLTFETSFIPPHSTESVITRQSQSDNEAIQNIESTCHTEPLGEVSKSLESSPQTPQNFIIRGDNLDALKILKSAYTEKIKMIYIDPPYNTKNENFIYPDNFRKDYQAILQEVGLLEIDENGEEKESETLKFFRNIQGSRTHSGWLSFMLPRLKLARDLLKDDGVIFISIDDNEQANLKILCDEIFGEENFVANIVWNSVSSVLKQSKHIRKEHEYILVYAKDKDSLVFSKLENTMKFENPDNDPKGEWFSSNAAAANQNKDDNKFSIQLPNGDECIRNWKFSYSEFINGEVDLYFKGGNVPRLKIYKSDYNALSKIQASILSDFGSLTSAKKEIELLLGNKELFDTPKPVILAKHLLKISTNTGGELSPHSVESSSTDSACHTEPLGEVSSNVESTRDISCLRTQYDKEDSKAQAESTSKRHSSILSEKCGLQEKVQGSYLEGNDRRTFSPLPHLSPKDECQDIVLDFFAGSGTTAHAIMELNKEDGGNRRFILVQIDEPINEEKNKTAYDFCKNELKSQNPVISDITIERVKRASIKIADKNFSGFSVLSLSDKPELITDEKGTLKLLDSTISPRDKALNLALQSGKPLDKPLESIFENKLYKCEDCLYVIVCDKEVLEYLRNTQNEYIFIDAFSDISLESFLNLDSSLNDRLRVVY